MEDETNQFEPFRVWIDSKNRIVSFHEVEGGQMLEFADREMFLSCVDQYVNMHYRYQ